MALIKLVAQFPQILQKAYQKNETECSPLEILAKTKRSKRLKFVNKDLVDHKKIIENLNNDYQDLTDHSPMDIQDLEEESQICDLITKLIETSENHIEKHVELFQETLKMMAKIQEDAANFKEDEEWFEQCTQIAIDKSSLLIYDGLQVLKIIKRKILKLTRLYHIPYYYQLDDSDHNGGSKCIKLRQSVLNTFKNLETIIKDYQTLSDVLWCIRNYNYLLDKPQERRSN